jgi:hypothetical protein
VEDPVDVIVVHRRTGRLAAPTTLLEDAGGDLLQRTQPVHPVLRRTVAGGLELVGDEPIPELRIVSVDVDDRVDQMRVVPVTARDGVGTPLVESPGSRSPAPGRSP